MGSAAKSSSRLCFTLVNVVTPAAPRTPQSFRLVVDLVPGYAEHFRQHSFDQMVANHRPFCDLPSLRAQADVPFFFDGDKAIFPQALQGKRYRGSGHGERMGKGRGYHALPVSFRFRNGFQIVFFLRS